MFKHSKHIGIVACSAEGAALCYRTICMEGANLLRRYTHPEIIMHTSETLVYFKGVIDELKNKGCDAVVLGCTEIPLLITQEDSSLPILDSTRLLARAALKKAISSTSG